MALNAEEITAILDVSETGDGAGGEGVCSLASSPPQPELVSSSIVIDRAKLSFTTDLARISNHPMRKPTRKSAILPDALATPLPSTSSSRGNGTRRCRPEFLRSARPGSSR